MGTFLPQDQPCPVRPPRQVDQTGRLGHPGAVAEVTVGTDRRMPTGLGNGIDNGLDPPVDRESEGEPDPTVAAGGGERVGGAGGVGAGQQPGPGRVTEPRAGLLRQGCPSQVEHGDVVGGGVGARVAGPQQTGQRLPTGHLGSVQEAEQGVEPERLLPGRGSVLLLAVRDRDRGVEVQTQPASRSGPAPAAHAAARARRPAPRTGPRDEPDRPGPAPATVVVDATGPCRSWRSVNTLMPLIASAPSATATARSQNTRPGACSHRP